MTKKTVTTTTTTIVVETTAGPAAPTYVSIILDETGSMEYKAQTAVNTLNEYIDGLKHQAADFLLTLTKFNANSTKILHHLKPIKIVPHLKNTTDYRPAGGTNLYDAVAATIHATERDVPAGSNVLIVILTDGEENASKEYNQIAIKALVEKKQAEGWTFIYLADDMSKEQAVRQSGMLGVSARNTMAYAANARGQTMADLTSSTAAYSLRGARTSSEAFFDEHGKDETPKAGS